jgi:hypothetical protein
LVPRSQCPLMSDLPICLNRPTMLLGSGHLHPQGRRVRVPVVAPAIPAGDPTFPSQKTPTTLAGTTAPASPIPSASSSPSLASYDTPWPTHSQIRGAEGAAMMYTTNVDVASLMTRSSTWASHSTVGLTTWEIMAVVARGRTARCLAVRSHLMVAG